MSEWTEAARLELENYLAAQASQLAPGDVDPSEVIDDLRRHIEEEVRKKNIPVVQREDILHILNTLGPSNSGTSEAEAKTPPPPAKEKRKPYEYSVMARCAILLLGILLPIASVAVEYATLICSQFFMDPLPTHFHAFLFITIPVVNFILLNRLSEGMASHNRWIGFMTGLAIGIAFIYTLAFLPITPFAIIGIMAMGFGLFALSPILSLIILILSRRKYNLLLAENGKGPAPYLWRGMLSALVLLMLADLPVSLTKAGLWLATSRQASTRSSAISYLRTYGNTTELFHACQPYTRPRSTFDAVNLVLAFAEKPNAEDCKKIFYQVTGQTLGAYRKSNPGKFTGTRDYDRGWDEDLGGDSVGGMSRDLALNYSGMDGSIDGDAALGYLEWTMTFKNTGFSQKEARAIIQLPHDAVVSRLTLWIDGEEREAAFAKRSIVKEAYKKVVSRRRDPVLVTTKGRDRIFMQCFPVPPNGEMKVRIGISAPLLLGEGATTGRLSLPQFIDRNFSVPEHDAHQYWVESKQAMRILGPGLPEADANPATSMSLKGKLGDEDLSKGGIHISMPRDVNANKSWTKLPFGEDIIVQSIGMEKPALPSHIVMVVDASRKTNNWKSSLQKCMESLPRGVPFNLVLAADTPRLAFKDFTTLSAATDLSQALDFSCAGGSDNVPALELAWDLLSNAPNPMLVWLHNAQPMEILAVDSLLHKYQRSKSSPGIYSYQVDNGMDIVHEKFDGQAKFKLIPKSRGLREDLGFFFQGLEDVHPAVRMGRYAKDHDVGAIKKTSVHLASLWGRVEVENLLAAGTDEDRNSAILLANQLRIVTPVSGAVVLENQQQYDEAGLHPATAEQVPSIPEPEVWVLLIAMACAAIFMLRRRGSMAHA